MASLRCLVTGGAGFVGSHLTDHLLGEGHEVIAIDNLVTGFTRNVAHLADDPKFTLIEHDVCHAFPDVGRLDRIFNLACPASPPHYQRDPLFTTRTCFLGALHCLELAVAHGARMVQASTSEVYGDPRVHPQPETYRGFVSPVGPRACYDEGKRVAETLCADYRRHKGVDVRIARIFNTYGPRMDPADGRVVSNFAVQALRGEDLTVYGDGTQTRSFCYVDDLLRGLTALVDHGDSEEAFVVNLGNDTEHTMIELAQMVLDKTGARSSLTYGPLPTDDPVRRRPDLTTARTVLGYEPEVSLERGLDATIAHFRKIV